MQDWKHAFWLARFELRASKKGFLGLFVFFIFMMLFFVSSAGSYLENNFAGFDVFFILFFTVSMIWTKPKDFQNKKINGEIFASPSLVMLNQLPIRKGIIVKSRFIVHFVYAFPFQLALLVSLYLLTPELQELMSLGSYGVFSIIWLAFGIYAGSIFPASDAGEKLRATTAIVYGFIFILIALFVFAIFQLISDYGVVQWTIIFAQKWPFLSSILSILLAFFGFNYWQRYMKKTMEKLDYL
ncbi:hypothetical protein [Virgibacillus oceani]|uniref:Uncharacterized protein n=1 Tax=Virgibacillus oceani TaxID=1479511 RepID=A0A917H937_9BACI|nr:hypothetical protein [Virgibacillus oceani]GGG71556.1 hypothetical protein GCM10011398_14850 [Virgibacillus oceani]